MFKMKSGCQQVCESFGKTLFTKSRASDCVSFGSFCDSLVAIRCTIPCESINCLTEWYCALQDFSQKTLEREAAFSITIMVVTPIPCSRNSKMKRNRSCSITIKIDGRPIHRLFASIFGVSCMEANCFFHVRYCL